MSPSQPFGALFMDSSSAPQTRSSLAYRPYLDGLRAIAVLLVFVFHAASPAMPAGFIGVDVFFVLSGYLITRVLLSQYHERGQIKLGDFYARRVRRLAPALLLLTSVVAMREAVWGSILDAAVRLREILATLFYVANWNLIAQSDSYFAEGVAASPLRHAWSLAVEEQFYLIWPALLILLLVWRRRRKGADLLSTLLIAGVSALAMALLFHPDLLSRAYYGTDTRIHQPLIGAALALAMDDSRFTRLAKWRAELAAIVGLGAVVAMAVFLPGAANAYFLGGSTVIALATAAHIAGVESNPNGLTARFLSLPPIRYLGKISYGFYLWHWPIILWLPSPAGATFAERRFVNLLQFGVALAISAASYALIEDPIRSRRVLRGLRKPVLVVGAGVLSLMFIGLFSSALLANSGGELATAALRDKSYEACPDNPQPCVKVQADDPNAPVVALVGDSTAQAYDPALKILARQYGFTYVQAAVGGCPIGHRFLATGTDGDLHKPSNVTCWEEMPSIYQELLDRWNPVLIIGTSWNETSQHVTDGALVKAGTERHAREVETSLRNAVSELTSRGANFVFIDILPPGPAVSCLEKGGPDSAACDRQRVPTEREADVNKIFAKLASELPRVYDVSLTSEVCSDTDCPLMVNGIVMRYDGGHLTKTASERLAAPLASALARAGIHLSSLPVVSASP